MSEAAARSEQDCWYFLVTSTCADEAVYVQCKDFYSDGSPLISIGIQILMFLPMYICVPLGCPLSDDRSFITMVIVPIMISLSIIAVAILWNHRRNMQFRDDHSFDPDRDHENSSTGRSRQDSVDGDERMGTDSVLHPFVTDESILSSKVNLVSLENVSKHLRRRLLPGKASLL